MKRERWVPWFLLVSVAVASGGFAQPSHDLLIRGGRLLDGSGNPWRHADLAVDDGRITAVGGLDDAEAAAVLDAAGLYVAPGFIDLHSHAGEALARSELSSAVPLLAQGVTTVFVNPDGGGPVDLAPQRKALLEHGLGVNVAQMIGHGAVRDEVLGMAARAPDADELGRMQELVEGAMEAGAFGLSSGLFYAPGSYAGTDELVALARVAARHGGIYSSHIRDEADYSVGLLAAVDEVVTIAREAGLPGVVTHVKALGPRVWGLSAAIVHRIEAARRDGVEVYADQYPYPASGTSIVGALIPRWAQEGGREELRRRIEDAGERENLRRAVLENLDRRGGAERLRFQRYAPDPSVEGRTLAAVATERGAHPADVALDLLREGDASLVSFNMDEADVVRLMRQPWTATASDGGLTTLGTGMPHPRWYGTFPRKIRRYVLEEGVVDLGSAIRSMTSLPAAIAGLADRGLVAPGRVADLVVFDLDRLRDVATYDDPHRLAEGMVWVVVGGEIAWENGRPTGVLAGRVLRRAEARFASASERYP